VRATRLPASRPRPCGAGNLALQLDLGSG
jgi:hypothetical protein